MLTTKQDLYELRSHIMRNIQLADSKATSLVMAFKDELPDKDSKELLEKFNKVLFPVLVHDALPSGYEPFSITNQENLQHECDALRDILNAKFSGISQMSVIISRAFKKSKK